MTIRGEVVHGRAIGRELGYPTANIDVDCAALAGGVYASCVVLDGRRYLAVTNVGTNPTVEGACRHVETHLIGFSGDLYGRILTVRIGQKIRDERRFASLDELRKQIAEDCAAVMKNPDLCS